MGPRKFTTARPISAPYSSCTLAQRLGRPVEARQVGQHHERPVAARRVDRPRRLLRRLREQRARGERRGPVDRHTARAAASGRDSMPSICTGWPPRCASRTMTPSASIMSTQRSNVGWSASATARMTDRMSNGFLRPGFSVKTCADFVVKSVPGARVRRRRDVPVDRDRSKGQAAGSSSPGALVGVRVVGEQDVDGRADVGCPVLGLPVRTHDPVVAADTEVVLGRLTPPE